MPEQLTPGEFRLSDGTAGSIAGRGPALVLLHGVGLDRRMWQAQIYYFARSHSVVCYDLLGHGESHFGGESHGVLSRCCGCHLDVDESYRDPPPQRKRRCAQRSRSPRRRNMAAQLRPHASSKTLRNMNSSPQPNDGGRRLARRNRRR